jgi:hypothetical protein
VERRRMAVAVSKDDPPRCPRDDFDFHVVVLNRMESVPAARVAWEGPWRAVSVPPLQTRTSTSAKSVPGAGVLGGGVMSSGIGAWALCLSGLASLISVSSWSIGRAYEAYLCYGALGTVASDRRDSVLECVPWRKKKNTRGRVCLFMSIEDNQRRKGR